MKLKKYNLLLPIAGKAQRFIDAGYTMPKPLILAKGKHIINWSMESIDYSNCNLIFVVRLDHIHNYSIDKILKKKFGDDIIIVPVDKITRGSLETCLIAKEYINNNTPLIIYSPDIYFMPIFNPNTINEESDGFLLTFNANSPEHSYSCVDNEIVSKVAEKEVISEYANIGIYYFKTGEMFVNYGKRIIDNDIRVNNEFYIAPMYNLMIENRLKITAKKVEKVHVLGTPKNLEFFEKKVITKFGEKPIALSCDHSGYEFKLKAIEVLVKNNIKYIDVGTYVNKPCDYYDYVSQLVKLIDNRECDYGISFCRTGQGVNIAANKNKNIISALVFDAYTAEYAIRHNCANHFSIPAKYITEQIFENMIKVWTNTTFDGGRHFTRLNKCL